jgi:uncharacterized membrane-anchored protein
VLLIFRKRAVTFWGDAVTMTLNLGYSEGTLIFAALVVIGVTAQVMAKRFHPFFIGW